MSAHDFERRALIAYLAQRASPILIGRTALMKHMYFLQTLKNVPLGYRFSLYSYGPFDSSVLNDLGSAEALGFVESTPCGYGYRIESKIDLEEIKEFAGGLLSRYRADVDWVIDTFGRRNAGGLELDSTIVFIEQEESRRGASVPLHDLVGQVRDVKPHFSEKEIQRRVNELWELGLLRHVTT